MTGHLLRRVSTVAVALCLAACAPLAKHADGGAVSHRIRVRHPGFSSEQPKTYTLKQLSDRQGFPSGYSMTVDSVICPERTCRIITVKMTWDALGRYQRLELPAGKTLEKGLPPGRKDAAAEWTGTPFIEADYLKLDGILKDENSLLGRQKLDGMVRLNNTHAVDGITGATPASVRDAVVEGAALTCYNLWHWANGDVAAAAREQTHRQCGEGLLLSFLTSGQPHYVLFALEHLRLHKLFGPSAVQAVARAMSGADSDRIDLGLAYLREALPERGRYFEALAAVILGRAGGGRAHLLDRLASETALPDAFFDAVGAGLPEWKDYYEIHLFLQLAEKRGSASPALVASAARLLDSPDFFIARRAHGFLSGQPALDAQTQSRLQAFRDKAAREGRSL